MRDGGIVFVWDHLGPPHIDRLNSVAHLAPEVAVTAIQLSANSVTYDWLPNQDQHFRTLTIGGKRANALRTFLKVVVAILRIRPRAVFASHYDRPSIFLVACILRMFGYRVFTMLDSKYDDRERYLSREFGKLIMMLPYQGCLSASKRSQDYARFLGFPRSAVLDGYDTISVSRIRTQAKDVPETAFGNRHLAIVARLVPEKDLDVALRAFALLPADVRARGLVICGSGPERERLGQIATELGVFDDVKFLGFLQSEDISRVLAQSLVLMLPSKQETFGQVIAEAVAMAVPIIASTTCGARDELVQSGVNGFLIEPGNAEGLAFYITLLARDEKMWRRLSKASANRRSMSDVQRFATSVMKFSGHPAKTVQD